MSRLDALIERKNAMIDEISAMNERVDAEERDFDEDEEKRYKELKGEIEAIEPQIEREKEIETIIKMRSKPVDVSGDDPARGGAASGGNPNRPKRLKAHLLVDMARAIYQGGGNKYAAMMFCESRQMKEAHAVFKAVQDPADTTTAGWAAELVREAYGDFIELLRPKSVYARMPGVPAVLGRNGKILFPGLGTGVAGGWVGEGQPIPFVQGVTNIQEQYPYKLGVITGQTRELMERSDPSSDAMIRNSMVRDTAIVLDTTFCSADAAVAGIKPAGIRNGVTPVNMAPTGGTNTIEELDAGFTAMVAACLGENMDSSLVWLMSDVNKLKLRNRSTASGTYPYRAELDSGMFFGYPALFSQTQGDTEISLVHSDSLYKLNEGELDMALSTDATVHTSTTPEQIVSGGGTPTIPAEGNVRSAFQEDLVLLRLIMGASWGVMRSEAVQVGHNFVI